MSDFDKLGASSPVDAKAARQLSRGVEFKFQTSQYTFLAPPKLKDLRGYHRQQGFVDLTGNKFGRLTVLGMWERTNSQTRSGGFWICRCQCGKYCAVRSKPLKKGTTDRCAECKHIQDIQAGRVPTEYADATRGRQ